VIELESFSVSGLRSLVAIVDIPIRRPTIITGANDGGKSTTLHAVEFLLGGGIPEMSDHSQIGPGKEGAEPLRHEQIVVTGAFKLGDGDAQELGLDALVRLRRVADATSGARYELHSSQPVDPALRAVDHRKLPELKELAESLDIEADGPKSARASWLEPLRAHIVGQSREDAWVPAPSELVRRLPRFMLFSSTDEPDPERQIQSALRTAFQELLIDSTVVGPVRAVEEELQDKLVTQAQDLCHHVAERCPDLGEIKVVPEVTFSEALRGVKVLAAREAGAGVPLDRSGAGRRRRINLAVWEWTGDLVGKRPDADRAVIIAYDEPDTHLDYGHQRELVNLIREQCAKPGIRMLVATHSLNLIDRVNIEDVVHLRWENGCTSVERLMVDEHEEIQRYLVDVSQAMGLRNSVLLHERCFVGVEGPTEMGVLPILFRLVTGWSMQSAGIALISGNGNDGALRVVQFLKQHNRRLAFVLVDADSSDGKLFRRDKLRGVGVGDDDLFFVGTRELEDVFSDAQWAETANREWPRNDGVIWTEADFATLRASPKFSAAIEDAVRPVSSAAPPGKPGYVLALVQGLGDATKVPEQLTEVLTKLGDLASD
jgi:putative ATP-dependent endonuclease of the OLD family